MYTDNVEKRIQEDNLQHLALFSEYGRMALERPAPVTSSGEEVRLEVNIIGCVLNICVGVYMYIYLGWLLCICKYTIVYVCIYIII